MESFSLTPFHEMDGDIVLGHVWLPWLGLSALLVARGCIWHAQAQNTADSSGYKRTDSKFPTNSAAPPFSCTEGPFTAASYRTADSPWLMYRARRLLPTPVQYMSSDHSQCLFSELAVSLSMEHSEWWKSSYIRQAYIQMSKTANTPFSTESQSWNVSEAMGAFHNWKEPGPPQWSSAKPAQEIDSTTAQLRRTGVTDIRKREEVINYIESFWIQTIPVLTVAKCPTGKPIMDNRTGSSRVRALCRQGSVGIPAGFMGTCKSVTKYINSLTKTDGF